MRHPVPPNGVAPSLTPTPRAGALNAGAVNAGAIQADAIQARAIDVGTINCAPTGSGPVGVQCIAPVACSSSPRRRGGRGVRFAMSVALVVTFLFGRPAYGQGGFVAPTDLPFGPVGTIAAPHGAGVVLTNVANGAEQTVAVMPPVGVAGHAAWSPDRTRLAISRFGRR